MSVKSYKALALARAIPFFLSCLLCFWTYALCGGPLAVWRRSVQVTWCRICLWSVGLRLKTFGTPAAADVLLYVANHLSYLDIPVLSRVVPGTFVAKAEVSRWPLFGYAARITGTIFINRVGSEAKAQREELVRRLAAGEHLILFPEGTSTDGSDVAPFKTALFSLAEDPQLRPSLVIQPLSLAYTQARNGTALIGPLRSIYCWFGDATLAPHLARVLGCRGGIAEVRFHAPIRAAEVANRKLLARQAEEAVRAGIKASFAPFLAQGKDGSQAKNDGAEPPPLSPQGERAAPV